MLNRIAISLTMIAALTAAPFHVSARTCIVSDAPMQKTCQPACCANNTCCATSQENHGPVSPPLAKASSGPDFSAACAVTVSAICPAFASLDRQLPFSSARAIALASPQLAVLCTFLI